MKLKTIIVDDEPLAREGLLMYARECGLVEVLTICENALEAQQALSEHVVDLMFLDIQMPRITGIDFLKSISKPPLVIITSAYPNFALQGYELDVVDYLVKPYPFDRFLKALNKASELFKLKNYTQKEGIVKSEDFIFVKTESRYEKVLFDEILFIEGLENYIIIHTQEKKIITLMRMKNIQDILPTDLFIRTHKSYIICIKAIKAISGNELITTNGSVPISREKRAEIMQMLIGN